MHFVKMQGLGNDFVVVESDRPLDAAEVSAMSDRHFGIGADGVLSVGREGGVVAMGYWNADGSAAEMCGNGLRCVARYAFDRGLTDAPDFEVATSAGPRRVRVDEDAITVELGPVDILGTMVVDGTELTTASVGNPHAVIMVDDPATARVEALGNEIGRHPIFPEGTNVEFVSIESPDAIRLRVWERGVGETLACGSGMAAAAAVVRRMSGAESITVSVPGGEAVVSFDGEVAWLTAPAAYVFEGDWPD